MMMSMFSKKGVPFLFFRTLRLCPKHARELCMASDTPKANFYDVVISGGGMIGAAMAGVLGHEPLFSDKKILLLEAGPKKPFAGPAPTFSSRTVALSPATRQLLEEFGAWDHITQMRYQPVKRMQVWDSCSDAMITFQNDDMVEDLAYVVENDVVQGAIDEQLATMGDRVEVHHEAPVDEYVFPSSESSEDESPWAHVKLNDGETIATRLVIGADGFRSKVRELAQIHTVQWEYGQSGVCAVLKLSEPTENNVAWQRFLPTGPVAMLPLSDVHSCLIWSTKTEDAHSLLKLEPSHFVDAVNNAFWSDDLRDPYADYAEKVLDNVLLTVGLQGSSSQQLPPTVVDIEQGSRAAFPLGLAHATHYVKKRMALVGDAAHRVHPMAGQGANLGFGDITALREQLCLAIRNGADIGSLTTLLPYETARQCHNVPIMAGVDGLSRLYGTTWSPAVVLRTLGLQATNALSPLKDFFMKQAKN